MMGASAPAASPRAAFMLENHLLWLFDPAFLLAAPLPVSVPHLNAKRTIKLLMRLWHGIIQENWVQSQIAVCGIPLQIKKHLACCNSSRSSSRQTQQSHQPQPGQPAERSSCVAQSCTQSALLSSKRFLREPQAQMSRHAPGRRGPTLSSISCHFAVGGVLNERVDGV